eukprot:6639611-Lingulodinium_polyedra.AAC.1
MCSPATGRRAPPLRSASELPPEQPGPDLRGLASSKDPTILGICVPWQTQQRANCACAGALKPNSTP